MRPRSALSITILFTSLCLHAQTAPAASNVEIRVTDPAGAVIPEAEVTAKPTLDGPTISAKTDRSGTAAIPLAPGSYHISARASAFGLTTTEFDYDGRPQPMVLLNSKPALTLVLQVESWSGPIIVAPAPELQLLPAPPLTATIPEVPSKGQILLRAVKFRR